ncbi:MAG: hypothetical protein ACREJM_13860, partial [Candidatus Saccharimonadales bacterium]
CALFGLPMSDSEAAIFRECTNLQTPPTKPYYEGWLVCGRRAGKSFTLALIAVYLACFKDWRAFLASGEVAVVMVIARDRRQARIILRYIRGLLAIKMLARLVVRETNETVDLVNSVSIEVQTASYRSVRGYTLAAALCDELAFWPTDDAAEPDYAVLDALRPGLGSLPGAMLLCASSPYAQKGALYDAFRRYFGHADAPAPIWRAPTRTMNPTFSQRQIDAAMERDPAWAKAEYLAEFRTDVASFIQREVVDAAVVPGRYELPPGSEHYVGFADAAGGSGADSYTAAVAFLDRSTNHAVLAAVREAKPPFSPEATIKEFSGFFKSFGVRRITADRWGGDFPTEAFAKHGVTCTVSERVKSDIYKEFLPLINSGRVELLDNQRLVAQLCGLERYTARGGKDSVDHSVHSHDDVINSAAGAFVLAAGAGVSIASLITDEVLRKTGKPVACFF